jgi:hypothetical protein
MLVITGPTGQIGRQLLSQLLTGDESRARLSLANGQHAASSRADPNHGMFYLPVAGATPRLWVPLKLAPGNLFVAFSAAGLWEGHWPAVVGSVGAVVVMAITKREWLALAVGFVAGAVVSGAI